MVECELIKDWDLSNQFRTEFKSELKKAGLNLSIPAFKKHETSSQTHADSNSFDENFDPQNADPDTENVLDLNQG